MDVIPPGLPGPTHVATPPEGSACTATPYQLTRNAAGEPAAVTRWTFTDEERARIAAGADLFVFMYLDDRPLPATQLVAGWPTAALAAEIPE